MIDKTDYESARKRHLYLKENDMTIQKQLRQKFEKNLEIEFNRLCENNNCRTCELGGVSNCEGKFYKNKLIEAYFKIQELQEENENIKNKKNDS